MVEGEYPQDRVDFVVRDTRAKAVIDSAWCDDLPENIPVFEPPQVQPEDPALVIYTSGPTGTPKGVVISHRALLLALTGGMGAYSPRDVDLCIAPFAGLGGSLGILNPLLVGFTTHIAGDILHDVKALTDYIHDNGVTTAFFPPQLARVMLPLVEDQLTSLMVGSDRVVNIHSEKTRIYNIYGASETCGGICHFVIDKPYSDITPVGGIREGSRLYILDEEGGIVPDGEEGEICFTGQIFSGYLNQPELTQERLVPNPYSQGEDDKLLFKTNDIGYINQAGQLIFVQRKDWMVKVRGFRVEPGEIEAAIVRSTPAEQAVVKGFANALGESSLFGVYTAKEPLAPETVIAAISEFLPSYMIPAFLEQVDQLPLNANGKVDRKNIQPPDIAKFKAPYQAPENERERAICDAFMRVLSLEQVGVLDDFNLIGGDSISAAKVQTELADYGISASDILRLGTPQRLAGLKPVVRLQKAAPRDTWPLTFTERQMVTEQSMNPDSVAYNINNMTTRIEGSFDVDRLEAALNELAKRHDVLRSCYPMENGEYVHRIAENLHLEVARRSCRAEDVIGIIEAENRPFDLANAPLLRCNVFEHGEKCCTLHFCIHHIIIDGTGCYTFLDELFRLYQGKTLPPLAFEQQDYAVWQAENTDLRAQEAVFKEMFADGVPETEMPTHSSRPEVLPCADVDIVRTVPQGRIGETAKRLGITQYGLLMGVMGMTLGKYCGSEDVVVGTAMSGRTMEEQDGMLGMFVNTLPVRMKPVGDMALKDYVIQTAQTIRAVNANQTYPFERLVPMLAPDRNASRSPVFDVIFNYLQEGSVPGLPGLNTSSVHVQGQALQMDMVLEAVHSDEEIRLVLSYSRALYDDTVAENFMEQFLTKNLYSQP